MRVATCAVILLLMLTGCIQSTSGVPVREGASGQRPASYRQRLDKDTLTNLDRAAQLRAIDACSLVNVDAAGALGQLNYVGTGFEPDTCHVAYEVPKHDVGVMEAMPGFVGDMYIGAREEDYDNQGERTKRGSGQCEVLIPSGYPRELISYRILITGETRDGCAELRSVVDASRDLIRSPKLRADSTRLPQSKIARLDPCQVLDVWAVDKSSQDKTMRIVRAQSPYTCDVKLKGEQGGDEDEVIVGYQVRELDASPHPATRGVEYTHLRGVLTHFEDRLRQNGPFRGRGMCTAEAYVGLDDPITGRDAMSALPQWVDVVAGTSYETEIGCPKLLHVIEEAVRIYQEES